MSGKTFRYLVLGLICYPLMTHAANPIGRGGPFLGNTTARPSEIGAAYNFPATYAFQTKYEKEYAISFLLNYLPEMRQYSYVNTYHILPSFTANAISWRQHTIVGLVGDHDRYTLKKYRSYNSDSGHWENIQEASTQETIFLAVAYANHCTKHWSWGLTLRGEREEQSWRHTNFLTDPPYDFTYRGRDYSLYRLQGVAALAYQSVHQVFSLALQVPAINLHTTSTQIEVQQEQNRASFKKHVEVTYPWAVAFGYFLQVPARALAPFSLTTEIHLQTPRKIDGEKSKTRTTYKGGLRIEGRKLAYLSGIHFSTQAADHLPQELGLSLGIQLKREDGEPQLGFWAKRYDFAKAIHEIGILVSFGS